MATPAARWRFRVTYARQAELRDDVVKQYGRGALLVRVEPTEAMSLGDRITLEVVLPGGVALSSSGEVLNMMPGLGVAISVDGALVGSIRTNAAWQTDAHAGLPDATHERLLDASEAPPIALPIVAPRSGLPIVAPPVEAHNEPERVTGAEGFDPARYEALSAAQKMQVALHGSRDERNAVLRDRNRSLHAYVLKNPQVTIEDIAAYARNAQMSPDFLKQIGARAEWLQRAAIAQGLARNPRTPPAVALQALEHVGAEALRQMAKGVGAPPHVVVAARKRVVGPK